MMTAITFLLLLFFAIGTGHILLTSSIRSSTSAPLALQLGTAYFSGMAMYITMLRLLSSALGNAQWAVYVTLAGSLTICLFFYKRLFHFSRQVLSTRAIVWLIPAACLYAVVALAYWLPSAQDLDNPFSFMGTLHSIRYAWIANFINECGVIPVIGQNTGQSMLSYMAGSLAGPHPYIFLYLWLVTSIAFLSLFLYGFIRLYEHSAKLAFWAVFIIMFGNTALSMTHVLVIDSGSPFAMNGYTDTLFGVFSVLMLLLIHAEVRKHSRLCYHLLPYTLLLCVANFFTAPQNMLYLLSVIPVLILLLIKKQINKEALLFWLASLLISGIVAVPQGGMLTPRSLQTMSNVPGLMTTTNVGETKHAGVHFYPGIPFHYGWRGEWIGGHNSTNKEIKIYSENWKSNVMPMLWLLEQVLFTSLRILFFPILGLAAIFMYLRRRKDISATTPYSLHSPYFQTLGIFGAYIFGIGFIINFTLVLNGYKWELSRFMIPGIMIGMLGFAISVLDLWRSNLPKAHYLFVFILILTTVGPISNIYATIVKNIQSLPGPDSFYTKIQYFYGAGPVVEENHCKAQAPE